MTIKVGDSLPNGTLTEFFDTESGACAVGPNAFQVADLVKGKKIALFAVPGEETGVFSSPYQAGSRIQLPPHESVPGTVFNCPATGRPLTVPPTLPAAWRYVAEVRQAEVPEARSPFILSEEEAWQPVPAGQRPQEGLGLGRSGFHFRRVHSGPVHHACLKYH